VNSLDADDLNSQILWKKELYEKEIKKTILFTIASEEENT